MDDLISRQAAINAICSKCMVCKPETCSTIQRGDSWCDEVYVLLGLPSVEPEMIREIRKWINSNNRGRADYFIVDKIEEIINKYE